MEGLEGREGEVDEEREGLDEGFPSLGDLERQKCIVYGRRERYYCLRVCNQGRAKAGVVVLMVCGRSMG